VGGLDNSTLRSIQRMSAELRPPLLSILRPAGDIARFQQAARAFGSVDLARIHNHETESARPNANVFCLSISARSHLLSLWHLFSQSMVIVAWAGFWPCVWNSSAAEYLTPCLPDLLSGDFHGNSQLHHLGRVHSVCVPYIFDSFPIGTTNSIDVQDSNPWAD
jgi:hypothetical protein